MAPWTISEPIAGDIPVEAGQLLRDAAAEAYEPRRPGGVAVRHGASQRVWVARDRDGAVAGCATLIERANDRYAGVGKIHIVVRSGSRRRGLGTELLARLTAAAAGAELHTLYGWAPEYSAGHGFLAARLDCRRGEELWSVRDGERLGPPAAADPPGLAKLSWSGPCPPESLDAFVAAHKQLEINPRGSELGAERLTAALLADVERQAGTRGDRWLTLCAQDRVSAEIAGFTQLTLPPGQVAEQEFTGVVPARRRLGLGLWLKSAMLAELRRDHPGVRYVVTQNAAGNGPMLAINDRLGFRPYQRLVAWETGV